MSVYRECIAAMWTLVSESLYSFLISLSHLRPQTLAIFLWTMPEVCQV